ncbi:hypothetical protein CDAR_584931 [Caerostris darwini]|uniref:Uncharacterized protein n=1 Tax=Caerostris darwini TaxID=1538125 RepID=A0AAV4UDJ1_9ARAC|nr:hypothetical protein CDAR_584931 [Caerostris darwini]
MGGDQEFDDAMNEARSCIAAEFSLRNHTEGRPYLEEICHPGRHGELCIAMSGSVNGSFLASRSWAWDNGTLSKKR